MTTVEEILTSGDYDGHGSVAVLAKALKRLAHWSNRTPECLAKWYNDIAIAGDMVPSKGQKMDDYLWNAVLTLYNRRFK